MLGDVIERLEDPEMAAALLRALDDPSLLARLSRPGDMRTSGEVLAAVVRGFLETATDDHWVQLIGIMSRAEDPGIAALRAILLKALPPAPVAAAAHG